jgi:hypothetical protein
LAAVRRELGARVLGEGGGAARGGGLYRPWGSRLGMRARGQGCAQDRLGVGVPAPVGLRPKVADDGRDPPVSDSGRRCTQLGRTGPQAKRVTGRKV